MACHHGYGDYYVSLALVTRDAYPLVQCSECGTTWEDREDAGLWEIDNAWEARRTMTAHAEYLMAADPQSVGDFRVWEFSGRYAWGSAGVDNYEIRDLDGKVVGGPYYSHPDQAEGLRRYRDLVAKKEHLTPIGAGKARLEDSRPEGCGRGL